MILIYSLIFALILSLTGNKIIKKKRWVYYLLASIVAMSTFIYEIYRMRTNIKLDGLIFYIEKASIKGIISIAFFILVMFAGALNKKWMITKKLLSIRTELSIIASILMLPHALIYITKFIMNFSKTFSGQTIPWIYLGMVITGTIGFIIMIPLFITSFKKIKIKMKGGRWKKFQRWAYVFYGLAYAHILIVVLKGKNLDLIKLCTYNIVFISYIILKLYNIISLKKNK